MKATWTKVYSGPGYPIDPQREERRMFETMAYKCIMVWPTPETTLYAEAIAIDLNTQTELLRAMFGMDFQSRDDSNDVALAE